MSWLAFVDGFIACYGWLHRFLLVLYGCGWHFSWMALVPVACFIACHGLCVLRWRSSWMASSIGRPIFDPWASLPACQRLLDCSLEVQSPSFVYSTRASGFLIVIQIHSIYQVESLSILLSLMHPCTLPRLPLASNPGSSRRVGRSLRALRYCAPCPHVLKAESLSFVIPLSPYAPMPRCLA